jgi:FlaA1/EpsC-like NDP-sugar epimerase
MTRYFMSIPEAVNLILHAACLTEGDDIYVLRMGEVVRIVELAERMIRMRGLRPYQDIDIKFTGMRPGEKMHEELFDEFEQPIETVHPYIVKIDGWDPEFDILLFMERLGKLTNELSTEQALLMLRSAIESKHEHETHIRQLEAEVLMPQKDQAKAS